MGSIRKRGDGLVILDANLWCSAGIVLYRLARELVSLQSCRGVLRVELVRQAGQQADLEASPQTDQDCLGRVVSKRGGTLYPRPIDDAAGQGIGTLLGLLAGAAQTWVEKVVPPRFGADLAYGNVSAFCLAGPYDGQRPTTFYNEIGQVVYVIKNLWDRQAQASSRAKVARPIPDEPAILAIEGQAGSDAQIDGQQ